jgi:hypothetical protein
MTTIKANHVRRTSSRVNLPFYEISSVHLLATSWHVGIFYILWVFTNPTSYPSQTSPKEVFIDYRTYPKEEYYKNKLLTIQATIKISAQKGELPSKYLTFQREMMDFC